jgi:topoisomerase-4 subunit A
VVHYFAGSPQCWLLLSTTGGYGFLATVDDMLSRQRGGKTFVTCAPGEALCKPSPANVPPQGPASHVACVSTARRILTFPIGELRRQANGGRGLLLIDLDKKETLAGAAAYVRSVVIRGMFRGKEREETLEIRSLNNALGSRATKGKAGIYTFEPTSIDRVE